MNDLKTSSVAAVLAVVLSAPAGAQQQPQAAPSAPQSVGVGESVPAFDAAGLDGVTKHIAFTKGGGDTILLFFLSGCPACHKMIPEWNRFYDRKPKGVQVYGVLLDKEPPGFFMATPISFPVLRSPGPELNKNYKIHKVPLTLRVGPGGIVKDVGLGQLDGIRLGELFRP